MGEYDPIFDVINEHLALQQNQTQQLVGAISQLTQAYRAPKRTMAIRDERGKIIGGETRHADKS